MKDKLRQFYVDAKGRVQEEWEELRPPNRVRTPTVLQMEAVECGAASLAMILAYHGRIESLEVLRIKCGVSRDGSKASNILKAARTYGLKAKGFKMEPKHIAKHPLPMIIYWEFRHFLVVEGMTKRYVYVNDPNSGPRTISKEEFASSFTGIGLIFEPTAEFKKGGKKPSLVANLRKRLIGSQAALAYLVLAGLALVIVGLIVPTFTRVFVDKYLVGGLSDWVAPLLFGMFLTALMMAALTWLQRYYLLRLETKLALSSSASFFWHVLRLPIKFYTQRYAGDISWRVGLNDKIAFLLSGELATTTVNVVLIFFFAILMWQYDVILTLIGILMATLNLIALRYVARRRVNANQKLLQDRGRLYATSMGGLQMIETLKATGGESNFFARWAGYQAKVMNAEQDLAVSSQILSAVPPLLSSLTTVAILVVGGLRVMDGLLTVGMLVALQILMFSFIKPVNQMVDLGGKLQEIEGDMNRLNDVLRYAVDEELEPTRLPKESSYPLKLSGQIELRNLTFGYNPLAPPLIKNFSLTLNPGARVALVGGSGSGKSTIAKLVTALYEPWEGEILFDGYTRRELPRSTITNSLAMVDQQIFLFEGTIRDNLTLWDPSISELDILQAAKDAAIHDDIADRANTYDSHVVEAGRNFSGGQRQRLEIARALVNNPTMLVLDEATSALDPMSEKIIDDNLRRRGCTCLIIAHRLSTIRDCDEIIVLEQGKVVERGTHEQLHEMDGVYAKLIKAG